MEERVGRNGDTEGGEEDAEKRGQANFINVPPAFTSVSL